MKPLIVVASLILTAVMYAADLSSLDAQREIASLRKEIAQHDELYHRKAAPAIEDAAYDRLKQRLLSLERRYPRAAESEPRLPSIGDDRSGLFETHRHRVAMLSLEKAHDIAALRAFDARLVKLLGSSDLEYVIEPKYDGLAISVTYEKGKLVRAVTRGNGVEGDDITANVRQIPGVVAELRSGSGIPVPDVVELRGEIYVPNADFERVNAERENAGEPRFANPRNLAAGTVRQLDGREVARRSLQVVFFGLGECSPTGTRPRTQLDLHAAIRAWGLPAIGAIRMARGIAEVVQGIDDLGEARSTLPFATDGAVIKLNSMAKQMETGVGESAPRWAIAFKFAPERVETVLRAITLQVGRTGVLTPVAELAPVQVGGSRVTRATLHNREEIARKDLRIGDTVYVEKAGDVIPAVVGVNLARRPAEAAPFAFPLTCPECYTTLARSEGDVTVRCPNFDCPAQVRRRVEHFASKACMDIDGVGPAMIESLVANGWVKDVPDLYRLQRADLLTLGKNNEKSVDRLLSAIERSKRAELWRVIHGMGLMQVGASTAKDLARQCGSLAGLAEHGGKAAAVLAEPRCQGLIADLIAVGLAPRDEVVGNGPLAGKVLVLTGALPGLTRAEAIGRIEKAGGKVAGAVTRSTDFLVVGAEPGAKLAQAREFGVPILDAAALIEMLDGK